MDPKTSDVVTMVSLVSSADSDSDVENSPGDDKLINELRSKLPTTPIIKTSINPNPSTARKPIKSGKLFPFSFYVLYIRREFSHKVYPKSIYHDNRRKTLYFEEFYIIINIYYTHFKTVKYKMCSIIFIKLYGEISIILKYFR
jgi:hypothetical protein